MVREFDGRCGVELGVRAHSGKTWFGSEMLMMLADQWCVDNNSTVRRPVAACENQLSTGYGQTLQSRTRCLYT